MKLLYLITVASCCFVSNALFAGATRTTPTDTKTSDQPAVKNPKDQTDAYAIPLDTSEMEEDEEEKELQKQQKKTQSQGRPYQNQKR